MQAFRRMLKISLVAYLAVPALALAADDTARQRIVAPAPLVSIATHDAFFDALRALCGKAFEGKLAASNAKVEGFEGRLVMHVRQCSDSQLQIPFHVGDDHSRTWIITKTGSGLSLKHDHRHKDGSSDTSTMYGGHTVDAGWSQVQSFPADAYSKALFVKTTIPQSINNVWQMFVYPDTFSYRLIRESREFRVNFDLRTPVPLPPTPWGYAD